MRLWPFSDRTTAAGPPVAATAEPKGAKEPEPPPAGGKPKEAGWFSSVYEGIRGGVTGARELASNAQSVGKSLATVLGEVGDPPKVVQRFIEALPAAVPFVDKKADAIAIGYLGEAGVGIMESTGAEILYVRAQGDRPARLRVSETAGNCAKLNAGVGTRAFVRCLYGDADLIAAANRREGTEMGVVLANVAVYKTTIDPGPGEDPDAERPSASGWATAIAAGFGVGVPVIGDLGMFSIVEKPKLGVVLEPAEVAKIEALLAGSPDRSTFRALATKLS